MTRQKLIIYSDCNWLSIFFQCYFGEYQLLYAHFLEDVELVCLESAEFIFIDCNFLEQDSQSLAHLKRCDVMDKVIFIQPQQLLSAMSGARSIRDALSDKSALFNA